MEKKISLKIPFRTIGLTLILLSILVAVLIYGPIFFKRYTYDKSQQNLLSDTGQTKPKAKTPVANLFNSDQKVEPTKEINPISKKFGLVIPTINVNVPVVKDVDATIPKEYFEKLKYGVGHYKGTPLPNEKGNVVIFGHSSSVPGVRDSDYSQAFLLLDKLKSGDKINLYYLEDKLEYTIQEIKEVVPQDLSVINSSNTNILTLITCWPPGTDIKRLVVVAKKD